MAPVVTELAAHIDRTIVRHEREHGAVEPYLQSHPSRAGEPSLALSTAT